MPFQPWAKMVFMDRLSTHMEPHSRMTREIYMDGRQQPTSPLHERFEYVCQEYSFASTLLVGGGVQESIDRASQVVP